jgi:tetratricopeptide (TPR) repeat protein
LFSKAEAYLDKGKTTKAIRTLDKLLEGIEPTLGPGMTDLYAKALDKQFSAAAEYLTGRKIRVLGLFKIKGYAAGVKIMERVRNRARSGAEKLAAAAQAAQNTEEQERLTSAQMHLRQLGVDAGVSVAKSYEQRGKSDVMYYELAHLTWLQIFEDEDRTLRSSLSWPTGEIGKDALLGMGRCKLLSYKGPHYDASVLTGQSLGKAGAYGGARHCYKEFISRYPQEAAALEIEGTIRQIDEMLAEKDFVTGQYYEKVGNRQAANLYYRMVAREWPDTPAAKKAAEALMSNLSDTENE